MILRRQMKRLVLTHKDRAGWFSACANCKASRSLENNRASKKSLRKTFLSTVFSVRLYGARSRKSKKLTDVKDAVKELREVQC